NPQLHTGQPLLQQASLNRLLGQRLGGPGVPRERGGTGSVVSRKLHGAHRVGGPSQHHGRDEHRHEQWHDDRHLDGSRTAVPHGISVMRSTGPTAVCCTVILSPGMISGVVPVTVAVTISPSLSTMISTSLSHAGALARNLSARTNPDPAGAP